LSQFNFQDFIGTDQTTIPVPNFPDNTQNNIEPTIQKEDQKSDLAPKYFDLSEFTKELYIKTSSTNKENIEKQKYMNAYDVASSCIANIVFKIRNVPVKSYANRWAPITLRGYLGKSVHNFIQENSNQFTEQETTLKIPSIRFSGRIDCGINHDVLVEIKSLPYKDYRKIIKDHSPRINDFYQILTYKYIIENYLEEAKNNNEVKRTQPPKLDKYDIRYLQFIYVAHDILAQDVESLDEAISIVDQVKKVLNSKHNTFYFMSNLLIDLQEYDYQQSIEFIKKKIKRVNDYLNSNTNVSKDDEFIDRSKCFFCLFSDVCSLR
jgi:hypothetical protein